MELNIIFIRQHPFPVGYAITKRHKYIIDYLNKQNISCGHVQTRCGNDVFGNPKSGVYGKTEYANLSYLWHSGIFGKIKYFKEVFYFINHHFRKEKINIIIFSTLVKLDTLPFYFYAKAKGYKIVFDIVENLSAKGSDASVFLKMAFFISSILYKSALCVFVISHPLRSAIRRIAPKTPVCLLLNSAPITSRGIKEGFSSPVRILYSGTFYSKDGLELFIKAYLQFCQNSKIPCELILTGGGMEKNKEKILNQIKNNPSIKYLGFVSDSELENIICNCDILTMTRINSQFANYGFPFKLSEYLASGNTVLATKVGDVPLYLKHLENAFLVEPDNVSSLVDALNFLTTNERHAVNMGRNGIDVAKQYFDVQSNGKRFVDFLNFCLRNRNLVLDECCETYN